MKGATGIGPADEQIPDRAFSNTGPYLNYRDMALFICKSNGNFQNDGGA